MTIRNGRGVSVTWTVVPVGPCIARGMLGGYHRRYEIVPVTFPPIPVTTHAREIAWGDDGVMQTLEIMAGLIHAATAVPVVVATARSVVAGAHGQAAQARALRAWLASVWRFTDDPIDRELLVEPAATLRAGMAAGYLTGDCDEVATTGAALAASVGLTPLLTVLGFRDESGTDRLCHVFASILTADGVSIDLDVTRPANVPRATRELTVSIF